MKRTKKIDFSDIPELQAADFRRARSGTADELDEGRKAIEVKLGIQRHARAGRPNKYPGVKLQAVHLKFHPKIVGWAKQRARRCHVGYQTFLNDFLLEQANRGFDAAPTVRGTVDRHIAAFRGSSKGAKLGRILLRSRKTDLIKG